MMLRGIHEAKTTINTNIAVRVVVVYLSIRIVGLVSYRAVFFVIFCVFFVLPFCVVLFLCCVVDDASQNAQSEDNFFEKARRCVLRAIGVGARKSLTGAGVDGVATVATPFPENADDFEAKHKIKVRRIEQTIVQFWFAGWMGLGVEGWVLDIYTPLGLHLPFMERMLETV